MKLFYQLMMIVAVCASSYLARASENCSTEEVDLSEYNSADEIRNVLLKIIPPGSQSICVDGVQEKIRMHRAGNRIGKKLIFEVASPPDVTDDMKNRITRLYYRQGLISGKQYWIDVIYQGNNKNVIYRVDDIQVREIPDKDKEFAAELAGNELPCSEKLIDPSQYTSAADMRTVLLKAFPVNSSPRCIDRAMDKWKAKKVPIIEPESVISNLSDQHKSRFLFSFGFQNKKEYWIDVIWKLKEKKILYCLEDIQVMNVAEAEKQLEQKRFSEAPEFQFNAYKNDQEALSKLLKLHPLLSRANLIHYTLIKAGATMKGIRYPYIVSANNNYKSSDDEPKHVMYYEVKKRPWFFSDTIEVEVFRVIEHGVVTNKIRDIKLKTIPYVWFYI
ncbi:MAG: hypothetical protein IPP74_14090 [Alphaproteobacteria bacterium]|nr:hypothetical protein [Alphaproteobacteria bacterium]